MFYVAAAVGAVVSFAIGCLWYTVLFGKKWQACMEFSDEKVKSIFVPKKIIFAVICEWFGAACLTGILVNSAQGVWIAAIMAAVFLIFNSAKLGIYDGKKPATIFINAGYMLVSVAIMAISVSVFL